jgi:tetratricopeptide (TPR) repeat protein
MNLKEYFEKHNNGTLTDGEWEQFAQQMMNAKFDQEKKAEWEMKLREQGIYRTPPATRVIPIMSAWKWMAAASFLLILVAAGWFFFLKNPLTPAQQMASNYLEQPFRMNQGSTRGEDSTEKNRGKAFEAFDNRQFEKSLQYFRIIEAAGQAKAADFFQMGLCLIYQKKPDYPNAIHAFQAARQSDPALYSDEINWFTGLSYLMVGDEKEAAAHLQKVKESSSSRNRDAAEEILKKLKH